MRAGPGSMARAAHLCCAQRPDGPGTCRFFRRVMLPRDSFVVAAFAIEVATHGTDTKGRTMKPMFDIPPVWLGLAIVLAWTQSRFFTLGLSLDYPVTQGIAGLLIGGGIVLIALAAWEFRRARTTIIPHQTPAHLITRGIFGVTRNPIYLADALILAGLILRFDAVLSLPLVPIFVWWIERHFVVAEEDRMRRVFRAEFARYERKVRRWI